MAKLAISSSLIRHNPKELKRLMEFGLSRLEVGRVSQQGMSSLEDFLAKESLSFGIHGPLPSPANYKELVKGSLNPRSRKALWVCARETCLNAARLQADYVLFHLPWYSKKSCSSFLKKHQPEVLKELLLEDCLYLQSLQEEIGIPVVLELMYLDPKLFTPSWLQEILEQTPILGTCLDVGHVHCSIPHFAGLDFMSLAAPLLPKLKVVHFYNCKLGPRHKHKPVNILQDPAAGWIDLAAIVPIILKHNPDSIFVLEFSKKQVKSIQEVFQGIQWTKELTQF